MKNTFLQDQEMTINSALYILKSIGGECDFHKLFKILYFADQKHLVKYGTAFSGDIYVAMKHGPVPSDLYDIFKCLRSENQAKFKKYFGVHPSSAIVSASLEPDMDVLSESNIECLDESILENQKLDFNALTKKSHGKAWDAAKEQTDVIDYLDIASEGGANKDMLQYIQLKLENQKAFEYAAI